MELRLGVYGAESDFSGFGSGFVAGIAQDRVCGLRFLTRTCCPLMGFIVGLVEGSTGPCKVLEEFCEGFRVQVSLEAG